MISLSIRRLYALLLFLTATVSGLPLFADEISSIKPTSFVTDRANVIPAATRDHLETLCVELQQKTGAQLAIITVRSLDDRPVEDYANELFHRLGIGQKGQSTGLLLLLAPNDRKYRIEVGYGLEPIINDARAGDAGRAMVPFLRQNDYGSALEVAAWQLAKYIADDKGVTLSGQPPVRQVRNAPRSDDVGFPPATILFIAFFVFVILMSAISNAAGRRVAGRGCVDGCFWAALLGNTLGGRRGGWGGSDWGGGGFGGGGGDSGGGFGGFGGGDSGGGGASGSW